MIANEYLVITGSLCLITALIEAWMLVVVFSSPESLLAKWIPGSTDLIKSHIDYMMMSQFLFIFYILFSHFKITPPTIMIISMCIGSVGNAGLFLYRALNPYLKTEPTTIFRAVMGISCLLTSIGYIGASWLVAKSAINLI